MTIGMAVEEQRPHPGFAPYRRLRERLLGLPDGQWVEHCNRLAAGRGLHSASGAAIEFVRDEQPDGALDYESSILERGRIACRAQGRGALHDLHNALTWLTFPMVKATLNRLHLEHRQSDNSRRGRVRDRVTLLDESGLLWLSRSPRLDEQLLARDWRGLMVENRAQVSALVLPIIIGHGLLEKLAAPYKAMTAHCLVCSGCSGEWPAASAHSPAVTPELIEAALAAGLDAILASHIEAAFRAGPPRLAPLPILGLPGWDAANVDASYYDDPRVFRAT